MQHPLSSQLIKEWQKEGKERFPFAHLWAWCWAPQIPVYLMLNPCNVDYDLLKHIYIWLYHRNRLGQTYLLNPHLFDLENKTFLMWADSRSAWRSVLNTSSLDGHDCFLGLVWLFLGELWLFYGYQFVVFGCLYCQEYNWRLFSLILQIIFLVPIVSTVTRESLLIHCDSVKFNIAVRKNLLYVFMYLHRTTSASQWQWIPG